MLSGDDVKTVIAGLLAWSCDLSVKVGLAITCVTRRVVPNVEIRNKLGGKKIFECFEYVVREKNGRFDSFTFYSMDKIISKF